MDFLIPSRKKLKGVFVVEPKFKVCRAKDLMIKGGKFYAIFDESTGLWSTSFDDVVRLIDQELEKYVNENKDSFVDDEGLPCPVRILYLWDGDTKMINKFWNYCETQVKDNFVPLDQKIIFADTPVTREDHATKRLDYPLVAAETPYYDKLISTLYLPEERHKIEWAIGSVVSGDSRWIQKFVVFVGDAGTGKSTVLKIIRRLFKGYTATIDARAIGSSSSDFSLESLRSNPLVAVQDDTDLSRIDDNSKLNSLVSHEEMSVNIKHQSAIESSFKCMIFLGSNKEVKITDSKSGLIRRLIDVEPSGHKLPTAEYVKCMQYIEFELGGIAKHCLDVYLENPTAYNDYVPIKMMRSTNYVYAWLEENYKTISESDGISLASAWASFGKYCDDADILYKPNKQQFRNELKGYFKSFIVEGRGHTGERVWNYYDGLRLDKLGLKPENQKNSESTSGWIELKQQASYFDEHCHEYQAQYASLKTGHPLHEWDKTKTMLSDIDTTKLHYVRLPLAHIVIDLDLKDPVTGEKSLELNLKAAQEFPPTYVETSKSGNGLHLHYIYDGDPMELDSKVKDDVEIKVYSGKQSLRRKLTLCNDLAISHISTGLPLKEVKKQVYNEEQIMTEQKLRNTILKCLRKEVHDDTRSNCDFIAALLKDAENQGLKYDVVDLRTSCMNFAQNSSNQSDYCMKLMNSLTWRSDPNEFPVNYISDSEDLVFFDVEVYPNLFVVVFKKKGGDPVAWINPTPSHIEWLLKWRIIGFNNRAYDNHILWARLMGYSNEDLFMLSQRLVGGDKNATFVDAYRISYTDVYDFASAMHKQSLKKWEIELGTHHQEMSIPWDKPVPAELWPLVVEYCTNDVIATEKVFDHLKGDWTARLILADIAGGTPNDTTNQLTTRIIFEGKPDKETRKELVYTDLSKMFPGYKYEYGKSTYKGVVVGEGGRVYAEPGIHENVYLLDIASMHPASIIALNAFGKYTKNYADLRQGRICIKHSDYDELSTLLNGKLKPYIDKALEEDSSIFVDLSNALKTALNSAYGLTSASFSNQLRHEDNIDNIVAKRGALFMVNLPHIKTDSIKIPNATPEIVQFVMDYGKQYGYDFELEAIYEKMCLVNDAVYIAKYSDSDVNGKHKGEWTATGKQFQVPYVFKSLFSHEGIEFKDYCETKSVRTRLYLDYNESLPDVSASEKELAKLCKQYDKEPTDDLKTRITELQDIVSKGHDYHFVGRVGSFVPVLPGCGGGLLMREKDGKYSAATGTKGFRWLEAETVNGDMGVIDTSYHQKMANDAKAKEEEKEEYTPVSDDELPF